MKKYYRVMLGQKSKYAEECFAGGFIGAGFGIDSDLAGSLTDDKKAFIARYSPLWLADRPEKTKPAASMACGFLYMVCQGISQGDIVLCPDGKGSYRVGEVISGYSYQPGVDLPHRRAVKWLDISIERAEMSEALRFSTGSIGTVSEITKYADELEKFIGGGSTGPVLSVNDETIEDAAVFAMEKHLEEFLVKNWSTTQLGTQYDIVEDEGELIGQQYPSDTGPIDILAISKDKSHYLVIELKKGRASDNVVGQIQRYMGFVLEELTEPGQSVRGVIIALEDDLRIRRALKVTNNIDFYRYEIRFNLVKN